MTNWKELVVHAEEVGAAVAREMEQQKTEP